MVLPGGILLGVVFLIGSVHGNVDHPDRVTNLPGAPAEPIFPLYSGFLEVSDNDTDHKMFYVLCEAIHADPSEAPLLVWLNGGPGVSSLFGLFLEHGPYLIDANTGQLKYNDFSWNQYANVLYIESPSGVGFSYSTENSTEIHGDLRTAKLNRKALHDFMTRVHPKYAARDFYLTGESYAGVYIPHLAREILNHKEEFRKDQFKGIAMINALVDGYSSVIAAAIHLHSLGIIPQKYGEQLFALWSKIRQSEGPIYLAVPDEIREQGNDTFIKYGKNGATYDFTLECNRNENDTLWHIAPTVNNAECRWMDLIDSYLNRDDVQMALHARTVDRPVVQWYTANPDIFMNYVRENYTIPLYEDIIASVQLGFRILFYTGDTDLSCSPLHVAFGAERIAKANNMTAREQNSLDWQNWSYLDDFGGARTSYQIVERQNDTATRHVTMDVLTARGAGHMIPISQPDRAFQIINNFITAEPLTAVDYSKLIPRR